VTRAPARDAVSPALPTGFRPSYHNVNSWHLLRPSNQELSSLLSTAPGPAPALRLGVRPRGVSRAASNRAPPMFSWRALRGPARPAGSRSTGAAQLLRSESLAAFLFVVPAPGCAWARPPPYRGSFQFTRTNRMPCRGPWLAHDLRTRRRSAAMTWSCWIAASRPKTVACTCFSATSSAAGREQAMASETADFWERPYLPVPAPSPSRSGRSAAP